MGRTKGHGTRSRRAAKIEKARIKGNQYNKKIHKHNVANAAKARAALKAVRNKKN